MTVISSLDSLMQQGDMVAIEEGLRALKDVNEYIYKDEETETNALHIACSTDSPYRDPVIILLVRMDADLNYPAKVAQVSNITALHLATVNGFHETIKLLLNLGSNVDLPDSRQLTPYCYALACKSPSAEMMNYFRNNYLIPPEVTLPTKHNKDTTTATKSSPMDSKISEKTANVKTSNKTASRKSSSSSSSSSGSRKQRESDDNPEIICEKRPRDSVDKLNLSKSSSLTKKSPSSSPKSPYKRKTFTGPFKPIPSEATRIRIVAHTIKDKPPGILVMIDDDDELIKVSAKDLYKRVPVKLRKYFKYQQDQDGRRFRWVKQGFGRDFVTKVLEYKR